jgi:signal transduction histidine kinase
MAFAVVIPLSAVLGHVIARRYLRASADRDSAIAKRSAALDDVERLWLIVRSFADTVNAGILILDVDRKPLLANQRLSALGGFPEGASGDSIAQIYGRDQFTVLSEEAQPLNRFLDGGEIDSELVWVGLPGDQSAVLVSGHQLHREDGSEMGSALIAQDVTDLVRAAREREDAMATLSHQLRTPLTSIVGYVDMIIDREAAPEVRGPLRVIARNAEHLIALCSSMLNGMRDLTKARIERLDLSDLIKAGVDVARGTQDGAARKWLVDVPASLTGFMDQDGLFEVLGNVLGNAVKYSPVGGVIRVSAVVAHPFVEVSVGNEGPSIEPLDMERIFDRFYRGANVKNSTRGTGIGLAVSRSIMKASGGAIAVANTPSGVAFTLRIRASDGAAEQLG